MEIRDATPGDLSAINDIYNHYVRTSTCTYQYEPETLESRRAWFEQHGRRHPVTVAVENGEVIGWGSLSSFREREGYRFTVEDTLYVRDGWHRRGVGRALLADLIGRAKEHGYRTVIAGVSVGPDSEQGASLALHRAFGFEPVARFRSVGFKFDRWLDVVFLQLLL